MQSIDDGLRRIGRATGSRGLVPRTVLSRQQRSPARLHHPVDNPTGVRLSQRRNCRQCVQIPGEERGKCAQQDGLEAVLSSIEAADAVVLASPVNYYNVTALYRRFLERLLGYCYWPWGQNAPKARTQLEPHKAVLVASAGMPGFLIPLATGAARALVEYMVSDARKSEFKIILVCPYVRAQFEKHPDWQDVVSRESDENVSPH